ncbi:hypothetical protein HUJ05_008350 [Dendroctonus ponderosae]|nr:hypothetical protein HUJ05_008350 [Dendroctonus ponderosae]
MALHFFHGSLHSASSGTWLPIILSEDCMKIQKTCFERYAFNQRREDCGYQSFKKVFFKLPKSSILEEFFREPTVRTIKLASGELRKRLHEELAKEALS